MFHIFDLTTEMTFTSDLQVCYSVPIISDLIAVMEAFSQEASGGFWEVTMSYQPPELFRCWGLAGHVLHCVY